MTNIDLKDLGLTSEELRDLLVEKLAERVLETEIDAQDLVTRLRGWATERVDKQVEDIAAEHVIPRVAEMVEHLTLQETNKWGEKKGEPRTFVEYMVERAEYFLQEKVDFAGKTRKESSYNWAPEQTRIQFLVGHYLQDAVECAVKRMMENANASVVGGLEKAIKTALQRIQEQMEVKVDFEE